MHFTHTDHTFRAWSAASPDSTVTGYATCNLLPWTISGKSVSSMIQPSPAPQGAGSRRHMLVCDVHLLLINSTGDVLFGRCQSTGYKDGVRGLPSGHLEAGESVMTALIREAREDIGVTIDDQAVEFAHVMHNSSGGGQVAFFFVVRNWRWSGSLPAIISRFTVGSTWPIRTIRWSALATWPPPACGRLAASPQPITLRKSTRSRKASRQTALWSPPCSPLSTNPACS